MCFFPFSLLLLLLLRGFRMNSEFLLPFFIQNTYFLYLFASYSRLTKRIQFLAVVVRFYIVISSSQPFYTFSCVKYSKKGRNGGQGNTSNCTYVYNVITFSPSPSLSHRALFIIHIFPPMFNVLKSVFFFSSRS